MTKSHTTTGAPRFADHPFVQELPASLVAAMGRVAVERTYATGDILLREGEPAREFLLVVSGKVALEAVMPARPRLTIQTVGPGEVVGWSWLTPPHRWRLDARAVKPTQAFSIDSDILRTLLDEDPANGYRFLLHLLPFIAQRLENTQFQLLDVHGD
ncbi:MAG: cyclic nucleotide-binding domain-containing protein [Thermoplasmata archaeon]